MKAREHRDLPCTSFPYSYWVGFMAGQLLRIAKAKNLAEAKLTAREGLGSITDPHVGLHEIDRETRRTWREAALREDENE